MRMVRIEDLLDTGRRAGLEIAFEGDRLLVRGPKDAGDVAQALIDRKAELRSLLATGKRSSAPAPSPAPPKPPFTAWPDADTAAAADFCLLLTRDDLPPAPFEFGGRWCIVINRERFLAGIQADAKAGPRGPRAKTGALRVDLLRLRTMLLDSPPPAGPP